MLGPLDVIWAEGPGKLGTPVIAGTLLQKGCTVFMHPLAPSSTSASLDQAPAVSCLD